MLLARDASPTQMKKITGILEHRDVPSDASWTQAELGRALGGPPVSAVAVTDPDLAAGFLAKRGVDTGRASDLKTEEEDRTHAG